MNERMDVDGWRKIHQKGWDWLTSISLFLTLFSLFSPKLLQTFHHSSFIISFSVRSLSLSLSHSAVFVVSYTFLLPPPMSWKVQTYFFPTEQSNLNPETQRDNAGSPLWSAALTNAFIVISHLLIICVGKRWHIGDYWDRLFVLPT